tara:strand:- start:860 stop:1711 length:852 start_codon:yes stop_codon:yes gene_type:complete
MQYPWWTSYSKRELLAFAKEYPYVSKGQSYVFVRGQSYDLIDWADDPLRDGCVCNPAGEIVPVARHLESLEIHDVVPLSGRIPVLAYGSNAAPVQLARKFDPKGTSAIPVIKADVVGFDAVYSAHITRYGAVPATLAKSPGATLHTFITWLSEDELSVMHESELGRSIAVIGNYVYGELACAAVTSKGFSEGHLLHAYISRFGALGQSAQAIALVDLNATGRVFTSATNIDVLTRVRDCLSPQDELDEFILDAVRKDDVRMSWSSRLRESALTHILPDFTDSF